MSRLLIVAVGNPLRGDDGVGWHIAEALRSGFPDSQVELVEIVACHQLTPELADRVRQARTVIFVDAALDLLPGQIELSAISASEGHHTKLSHALTPRVLLALTQELYGTLTAESFLLKIGGSSFEVSADLSEPVQRSIPAAVERIQQILEPRMDATTGVLEAGERTAKTADPLR